MRTTLHGTTRLAETEQSARSVVLLFLLRLVVVFARVRPTDRGCASRPTATLIRARACLQR